MKRCVSCDDELGENEQGKTYCDLCGCASRQLAKMAKSAVKRAIIGGEILSARLLACIDCGKPATGYDHRDYTKPLEVEPVCHSCNWKRGPTNLRLS